MPIVIVALLAFVAVLQPARAQSEIHVIPNRYTGWVAIAFRTTNGESPKYEGEARLYQIPANGVLLTQAEPNLGSSPEWKFYFGGNGTRSQIQLVLASPVSDTPGNRADPTIGVFGIGTGRAPGGAGRCQVDFISYFVGTKAQFLTQTNMSRFQNVGRVLSTQYECP